MAPQRVALARALAVDPRMLLLDEPLAALDAGSRRSVRTFVREHLRAREIPALITTHDVRDVCALDCTVYVLEAGRIVQSGSAAELARRPASAFVEEFFDVERSADSDQRSALSAS